MKATDDDSAPVIGSRSKRVSPTFLLLIGLVCVLVFGNLSNKTGKSYINCLTSPLDEYLNGEVKTSSLQHNSSLPQTSEVKTSSVQQNVDEKPRIAIISGFVTKETGEKAPRVSDTYLDHLVNKACYASLWGYDYIFNTTWGFEPGLEEKNWWMNFGTWHRVPHVLDRIDDYDWILYADVDYVFQDMALPLESFLKEWKLNGKDVHIFVPKDSTALHVFSAFAVFIRNSPFGHRVLENWMEFANGLCPKGNLHNDSRSYNWMDTDQPGLWYALVKTHSEFFPGVDPGITCSNTTGLINTDRAVGPEFNKYFSKVGAMRGSHGDELRAVPDDQPILWSTVEETGRNGLGVQLTFGRSGEGFANAFALHKKKDLPENMMKDIETCKKMHDCRAEYDSAGELHVGCHGIETVAKK